MFHCRHHASFFVLLTFTMPCSFEAISSKKHLSWSHHSRVQRSSSLLLFQHGSWQILVGLFCAWALGETSFVDDTHACHSSALYTILCHWGNNLPSLAF
ncbi:unnamed protein product [Staurois parvus]|uniref:Secreted protein n=1 Tax=Staurois parvus TaxID=386267 RepID=A0ABN9D396_9NEOB|nr:unnamed protein product [Staurois parvus]